MPSVGVRKVHLPDRRISQPSKRPAGGIRWGRTPVGGNPVNQQRAAPKRDGLQHEDQLNSRNEAPEGSDQGQTWVEVIPIRRQNRGLHQEALASRGSNRAQQEMAKVIET